MAASARPPRYWRRYEQRTRCRRGRTYLDDAGEVLGAIVPADADGPCPLRSLTVVGLLEQRGPSTTLESSEAIGDECSADDAKGVGREIKGR
jgi:hypothetical protein